MHLQTYLHTQLHVETRTEKRKERHAHTQQLLIVWRILEWPLVMHARWTKNNIFFCTH